MAFASQWTLTKRHTDTTAVLGSQNTTGDFYCWKSRDFASICLRKGTVSRRSPNVPSRHPASFTGVLLTVTRRRTERSLPSPARWNSLISSQPLWQPGQRTGSQEGPLSTTAWGQPAAWEITTNTLIYSNKTCKQPCTCVRIEHTYLSWKLGRQREVFTATARNLS